jgi:CDP-2,3-bis-(O-geranylgeranyl)-sn-glycerol synthase
MDLESYTTIESFFIVLWIMMPAYLANTIAVLTGGKYPIDQGRIHSDGNRILGDGKTWSGLVGGTLGGVFIGFLQVNLGEGLIEALSGSQDVDFWGENSIIVFFLLSFGALFGDMTASFIKRRSQLKRGDKSSLLDMFDFIGMALLLSFIFANEWLMSWILDGYVPLLTLLIATPILHRGVNIIGFKIGVKNEPW